MIQVQTIDIVNLMIAAFNFSLWVHQRHWWYLTATLWCLLAAAYGLLSHNGVIA